MHAPADKGRWPGIASLTQAGVGGSRALTLIGIVVATFGALWPTTLTLLERWSDTVNRAYTHGVLIVALTCFMLWRRRDALARVAVKPSWLGLALTLAAGLLWLLVYRCGVQVGHQALLPLICLAAAWAACGFALLRQALLPLGYLFFAIPVWDAFVPPLQWLSAFAVRGLLSLIGIPVYFDGLEFQIPAGRFEISGGCSGLHFLTVALAISVFYGELDRDRPWMRIRLVLLAALFALATNWIRIAIIIIAGHLTEMNHYLVSGEHYSFGWGMFAVMMTIYFLIVRRWAAEGVEAGPAPTQAANAVSPLGVTLAVAALAVPAMSLALDPNVAPAANAASHQLPATVPGWSGSAPRGPAEPRCANVDQGQWRRFEQQGDAVDVYTGVYLQQQQGKELADYTNRVGGPDLVLERTRLSPDGWLEYGARQRDGTRWLLHARYRIDDREFTALRRSQLDYGLASLHGDPLSSVTVLRTVCHEPTCEGARATLTRFTAQLTRETR